MSKIKNNYGLIIYILIIFAVSGMFINSLYIGGITWDENDIRRMVFIHFEVAMNNIPLDQVSGDLIYYGIANILPGYLLHNILSSFISINLSESAVFFGFMHVSIFIMGLLTSFLVYKILKLFGIKKNIAYLSASLLLLYPVWLGHSFFNFKDSTAAFYFTGFTYFACKVLTSHFEGKISKFDLLKYAFFGALLCGTKLAFLAVVITVSFYISISSCYCNRKMNNKNLELKTKKAKKRNGDHKVNSWNEQWRISQSLVVSHLLAFVMILFLSYVFTPGAWHQPLEYVINEFKLMSNHTWDGCTNIFGECIRVHSVQWLAWRYLLQWYLAQIPLLLVLLTLCGVISLITFRSKHISWLVFILILIQLFELPLLGIIKNSPFYGGTRHTLFCVPMLVIIAGFGLEYIVAKINLLSVKYVLSPIVLALTVVLLIDLTRLTPYQYAYFNELYRLIENQNNTDTDYWGFSLREALNTVDSSDDNIFSITPLGVVTPYFTEGRVVEHNQIWQIRQPVYAIGVLEKCADVEVDLDYSRCGLFSSISRNLLFKSEPEYMSKVYYCR